MKTFAKMLGLVILLNIIRYVVGGPIEMFLIGSKLFGAMDQSASYFNTEFSTVDWITSYFYNFVMWFTIAWLFHLLKPVLRGSFVVTSLKVFGMGFLFFASVSAIYMNHYSHPRDFYLYSLLDALIIFPLVGLANGLLYPRFFRVADTVHAKENH